MDDIRKDKRFADILKDPKFKKMPTVERKTKIDKRFQAMFDDEEFKLKYSMDKRGRPWKHTTSEDLKKFYAISSSSSSSSESEQEGGVDDEVKDKEESQVVSGSEQDDIVDTKTQRIYGKKLNLKKEKKTSKQILDDDTNRKGMFTESKSPQKDEEDSDGEADDKDDEESSSEDESSSDELGEDDESDEEFNHKWEELDAEAPVASEITRRIAVCNMDWDRIRAEDILTVFNSFKPGNGLIHSVKIYPSEFGMKRMEEEKLRGPTELVSDKPKANEEDSEKSGYHREKLRQYQINRLKYYFAVVECDSPDTANVLYEQLNGMEYESSAVCMDIRFIPDDMVFDQEPKCVAESIPDPTQYKPRLFVNSALQQVKVNLTWDETDPVRRETLKKAFREPETIEQDIKDYLASSTSESEDEPVEENDGAEDVPTGDGDEDGSKTKSKKQRMLERIAKYKALLQSFEEKEKENENKYDMEITWEPGLKEKTEKLVKDKLKSAPLTPFEEKLKKKKEERKLKKIEKRSALKKGEESASEDSGDENLTEDEDAQIHRGYEGKSKKSKDAESDQQRMAELALLVDDDGIDSDEDEWSNRRKKKKKATMEKHDGFEVDPTDSRFSAIYSSHLYNIDPSDPHFKDTKGMQTIIQEKLRKRQNPQELSSSVDEPKKKYSHLSEDTSNLLESIKRKTKKQKFFMK